MDPIDKGLAKQIGRREALFASLVYCVLFFVTLEVMGHGLAVQILGLSSEASVPILISLACFVFVGRLLGGWCGVLTVHKGRSVSFSFVWAFITYVSVIAVSVVFAAYWTGSHATVGTAMVQNIVSVELLVPLIMTEFVFPPLILAAMFYAWRLERNIARLNAAVAS